ncbi:alpha/beta fold hydrolase [Acetobacter cibinongensis]|uniref:AB hydrolase-1 domain-containing protein n=1 Tax=Acetobacter cibinongensis TaxID=146475 RepID=A0A1Z5YSB8_9PROT|nr:alpha/beta hydrolase [Acetobacter cibinongensis]OUJ01018.1 hypothetical protein HK14_11530 [Acetobacter cibinongensis]
MRAPLRPVFMHGWACGPEIWQPLQQKLGWQQAITVDGGYFSDPSSSGPTALSQVRQQSGTQPILGIGHSLGFMQLVLAGPWPEGSRFIAINGFSRFASDAEFKCGVPPRILARMQVGLLRDAGQVVNNFRARCGLAAQDQKFFNLTELQAGLSLLEQGDVRSRLSAGMTPGLVLAAKDDPIVPSDMTRAAFEGIDAVAWHAGGHMLPLTQPEFCAQQIQNFVDKAV